MIYLARFAGNNSRLASTVSPLLVRLRTYWLTHHLQDLSAGVDVYSDWIDACDTVAKEAADTSQANDGFNSYEDLAAGNERRNSEMNIDRHLVSAVGGNEYGGDFIDDD